MKGGHVWHRNNQFHAIYVFQKKLYTQIETLAQANNLGFAQTTIMLLTSSMQDPKLVLPQKRSDT